MSNISVLVVLLWSLMFGIASGCDEWKIARWPFLVGIVIFNTWVLVALYKK